MHRRDFLKGSAVATAVGLGAGQMQGLVQAHNWGKYDFGSGPAVADRLNQGPFPQYPPDAVIPGDDVVMTTTPSDAAVPNYGKGLITYITADMGTDEIKAANIPKAIEELVQFPLGSSSICVPPGERCNRGLDVWSCPSISGSRSIWAGDTTSASAFAFR